MEAAMKQKSSEGANLWRKRLSIVRKVGTEESLLQESEEVTNSLIACLCRLFIIITYRLAYFHFVVGGEKSTDAQGRPIQKHAEAASLGDSIPETQRIVEAIKQAEQRQTQVTHLFH